MGDAVVPTTFVSAVTPGSDGTTPQDDDYIAAFEWLKDIDDVSIISVPGIGSPYLFNAGMNYCSERTLKDCFYIGEMTADDDTQALATSYAKNNITNPNSYGALYFPWLKMNDPTGKSAKPIAVPPSGFIAGLYSRIDGSRGVWKAPAGTEASLAGSVGLVTELTDQEQGNLNRLKSSVCVIRKFSGAGIVSWGARTVSSDPEYKYIPVRRTAIMLRKSIYEGIQWAVFEPNDHRLWAALRLNVESFMNSLFRAGAFQGEKASDAYFVRCGLGDTMTQTDIDAGKVIVKIGFAALKPAEFVIVTIEQKTGK